MACTRSRIGATSAPTATWLSRRRLHVIDLALHHARSGYRVFPLVPNGKIPLIPKERGSHGCLDATTDLARVEEWWNQYPQANIGIATGRGLLVIDVDPRKDSGWLLNLQALELPQTFTVRTWSGGWHCYLHMPLKASITIGTDLLPGIDWRGDGGYVVAVGSIVNGATYEIAKNLPIAASPVELLRRIRARPKKARPIRTADGHYVIRNGGRNEVLFALGSLMRRFGCEFNVIVTALTAANSQQCEPAIAEHEVRQIAASVMRYAPADGP